MSLIVETSLTWVQRLCVNILKAGHVPKHVAFIMDGNRRFAKKANLQKLDAHAKGFDILAKTLQWCKELGINEITVYAFSIDNFKRSKDEVDGLMKLARKKFEGILDEKDKIMEHGICIRIIGNLSYVSPELRKLFAEVVILTENNTRFYLNIAFSYSSRDEITNSIKCIMEGVDADLLDVKDINVQLISDCMYTNKSPDPDLLVRTSGEMRLSDFLLWQISCTQVCFTNGQVLWPELSIWHLLAAIFNYQTNYKAMQSVKRTKTSISNQCTQHCPRVEKFINHLNESRRKQLESYVKA